MLIKLKKFEIPQDDIDAFRILQDNRVIDEKSCKKLKEAKGMRNIIAHEYGRIDDEIIYNTITEELGKYVEDFFKAIKKGIR